MRTKNFSQMTKCATPKILAAKTIIPFALVVTIALLSVLGPFTRQADASWGVAGDIPIIGDFNRDGRGDRAIFRPSSRTWFYDCNYDDRTDQRMGLWGISGDLPIAGDFDRDGHRDDVAVFRPSTRTWYYDYDHDGSTNKRVRPWAISGDLPIAGDFDRDGRYDDVAVFRPSTRIWYYDYNHNGSTDERVGPWGVEGDLPFAGDFDGDGLYDDVGVYRRSNARIYVDIDHNGSTNNTGRVEAGENGRPVSTYPDHIQFFCDGTWWVRNLGGRFAPGASTAQPRRTTVWGRIKAQ